MTAVLHSFQYLRFSPFATLNAWGYSALFADAKSAALFPAVPLRELVKQRKGFVRIDDAQNYSRCRVQLRAQGVVLRDRVLGSAIKTKQQQLCRAGDFLVAEIDAKLGGFGIVPSALDGAVVSSHYFLFETNEALLSREYLALCLQTEYFQQQVLATGSTNYAAIRPHHVQGYTIPLPPLTEQKRLVAAHQDALAQAAEFKARANAMRLEASRFLETTLGLKNEAKKSILASGKLHFVPFATLERWGELFLSSVDAQTSDKYPLVCLGDVIADLQNGWSPKCLGRPANADEWGILKLGAVSFGEFDETANKALPPHLKPQPDYEVKSGDVLISRANITQYVGACAFVSATRPRLIICDKIFRVLFKEKSPIDVRFTSEVLRIRLVRQQIENSLTGTSPTMKNISKPSLLNLRFPLPPLAEQKQIVNRLDAFRKEARTARMKAELTQKAATEAFETALFGASANLAQDLAI